MSLLAAKWNIDLAAQSSDEYTLLADEELEQCFRLAGFG